MALIYKRRVLAFAQETTPGTPVALTNSQAIFVFDAELNYDIPMVERNATGSLSKLPSVPGARSAKCKFWVELAGGGTSVPPSWIGLLPACGMLNTSNVLTFTSNQTNYKTLTIGLYEDGRFKQMSGAMGTFTLEGKKGEPMKLTFEFDGLWQAPQDVANLALPSYAVTPPRFASATFTVGGFAPKIESFSLSAGSKVTLLPDVTTVSAYNRAYIVDRDVKGKFDPDGENIATWDAYGLWAAGTTGALSMIVGSVTDNTITIAAPHMQLTNNQAGNRDGIVKDDIDFLLASSSAGDDELSITFS